METDTPTIRTARVTSKRSTLAQVEAYLYRGFTATEEDGVVIIRGTDWAGFTMDALRDRLLSGLHATEEVL